MMVGYLAAFFLAVFLLALGLSVIFLSWHERTDRRKALDRDGPSARRPLPLTPEKRVSNALSDFERSVLRDVYGMSNEEICFSEALLHYRDKRGHTYVTSDERADGFFQC